MLTDDEDERNEQNVAVSCATTSSQLSSPLIYLNLWRARRAS